MEQTTELFQTAIGLVRPWYVKDIQFTVEKKRLDIYVDFIKGSKFSHTEISEKGEEKINEYGAYDTSEKTWRHLNFFEHECYLHCRVPRIKLDNGKTHTVAPPFSGLSNGFTLLFEVILLQLCKAMTIAEVSRITSESDHKLWEMLDRYVKSGRDISDYTAVKEIGIDETSKKKGHNYISIFADLKENRVLFVTEGRGSETVKAFMTDLEAHKGKAENITRASIDLSPAFIKGVTENLPNAQITFDRFHVMKIINMAVDSVRRRESQTEPILKKSRYAILKNEKNLTKAQKEKRDEIILSKFNLQTVKAMHIRESFQLIYSAETEEEFMRLLKQWYFWATHCRIPEIIAIAKTIKRHWTGIVSWFRSRISNGMLEGINSFIQAAKAKARGYRTFKNFANIIYLLKGNLNFSGVNTHYPLKSA